MKIIPCFCHQHAFQREHTRSSRVRCWGFRWGRTYSSCSLQRFPTTKAGSFHKWRNAVNQGSPEWQELQRHQAAAVAPCHWGAPCLLPRGLSPALPAAAPNSCGIPTAARPYSFPGPPAPANTGALFKASGEAACSVESFC